jgi:hypothetical protein
MKMRHSKIRTSSCVHVQVLYWYTSYIVPLRTSREYLLVQVRTTYLIFVVQVLLLRRSTDTTVQVHLLQYVPETFTSTSRTGKPDYNHSPVGIGRKRLSN